MRPSVTENINPELTRLECRASYHLRMSVTGEQDRHLDLDLDAEQLLGVIPVSFRRVALRMRTAQVFAVSRSRH